MAVVFAAAVFRLIGPWAATICDRLGLTTAVQLWTWLRWPVVILLLLLTIALIYYLGPNIDQPFRYVTPGSVTAVIVWILASLGFSSYVESFGNYGATYGSVGGMVVLLLYLFVSSAVLLLGAEINATIHPAHGGPKMSRRGSDAVIGESSIARREASASEHAIAQRSHRSAFQPPVANRPSTAKRRQVRRLRASLVGVCSPRLPGLVPSAFGVV